MKYLVTGAAGFIASRTVELLLEQGHEVVAIDNLNDYYDVRLKTYRLHRMASAAGADAALLDALDYRNGSPAEYRGPSVFSIGRLSFHHVDVADANAMDALIAGRRFSAVLNLAARAGVRTSMEQPMLYMSTNAVGMLNILESMRRHGVKKVVMASTSSLYAGQPMPFTEDLPVNTPISPYAATKKAAEAMAYTYHHLYGFDVSILRYFTVYGPAGRPDMAPFRFIKWIDEGSPIQLFGDGTQSRDFTYVDDIARGTIAALKPLGYEIINLGGGNEPITINSMIASFEWRLGKKAVIERKPFISADMKDTSADISKAGRLLGWSPLTSPEDGFAQTVDWYLANRDWAGTLKV